MSNSTRMAGRSKIETPQTALDGTVNLSLALLSSSNQLLKSSLCKVGVWVDLSGGQLRLAGPALSAVVWLPGA